MGVFLRPVSSSTLLSSLAACDRALLCMSIIFLLNAMAHWFLRNSILAAAVKFIPSETYQLPVSALPIIPLQDLNLLAGICVRRLGPSFLTQLWLHALGPSVNITAWIVFEAIPHNFDCPLMEAKNLALHISHGGGMSCIFCLDTLVAPASLNVFAFG